jgi:hypothetical protein
MEAGVDKKTIVYYFAGRDALLRDRAGVYRGLRQIIPITQLAAKIRDSITAFFANVGNLGTRVTRSTVFETAARSRAFGFAGSFAADRWLPWGTIWGPRLRAYCLHTPSEAEIESWIRRNDAAREADRHAALRQSMAERLEETARLSTLVSELHESMEAARDVRPR